jgi:LAO/AO transport system kinase
MQSLAHPRTDNWTPPIVKTVASDGTGVPELAAAIDGYEKFLDSTELGRRRRVENWRERLIAMLRDELLERVLRQQLPDEDAKRYAAEVAEHKRDPYTLIDEIIWKFNGK